MNIYRADIMRYRTIQAQNSFSCFHNIHPTSQLHLSINIQIRSLTVNIQRAMLSSSNPTASTSTNTEMTTIVN